MMDYFVRFINNFKKPYFEDLVVCDTRYIKTLLYNKSASIDEFDNFYEDTATIFLGAKRILFPFNFEKKWAIFEYNNEDKTLSLITAILELGKNKTVANMMQTLANHLDKRCAFKIDV